MTNWHPDADYPVRLEMLPSGWAVRPLGEVIEDLRNGFSSASFSDDGEGLPHLRPMNITRAGEIALEQVKRVEADSPLRLQVGDIVFNNTNSRVHVGKSTVFDLDAEWGFSNHITRIRVPPSLMPKFVAAQLLMLYRAGYFYMKARQHVNQASISSKTLSSEVPLLIAPLNEQIECVTRIEADMMRLMSIEKTTSRVRHALSEFRKKTLDEMYQEALLPRQKVANEVDQQPSSNLRPVWQLGQVQLGKKRVPSAKPDLTTRPYLRVANVLDGRFDLTDVAEMDFSAEEWPRYKLEAGDLLLNEGQSPELVGRPAIFRGEIQDCGFQNSLIRLRVNHGISPAYTLLIFRHFLHSGKFRNAARWTTNLAHLTAKRFGDLEIPMPSLERQEILAAVAQQKIDTADDVVAALERIEHRVDLARSAVLAEAFGAVGVQPTVTAAQVDEPSNEPQDPPRSRRYRIRMLTRRRPLVEIVNDNAIGIESDQLFEASGFPVELIDEFYSELRSLMRSGLVSEDKDGARSIVRPKAMDD